MVQFIKVNSKMVNNMVRVITTTKQTVIFTKEIGLMIYMTVRDKKSFKKALWFIKVIFRKEKKLEKAD